MARTDGRPSSRRDTGLLAACLGLALLLLFLPQSWTQRFALTIRETALRPVIWLQLRAEEGRTGRARLEAALAQRDVAVLAARDAARMTAENRALRALLELPPREATRFLAADVLHQPLPTDERTLLIGVGTAQGARSFLPAITPEGLVGVVVRAGSASSLVNTWAHPEFRVSATTEDGAVLGIVAPGGEADLASATLEFRGVAYRDTVPEGAVVVTSGLGGVYPRGLPIGRVAGVRREEQGWERVYRVVPFVNPGTVDHVVLLLGSRTPADSL